MKDKQYTIDLEGPVGVLPSDAWSSSQNQEKNIRGSGILPHRKPKRRLKTIKIPRSRRQELKRVQQSGQALIWFASIAGLIGICLGILEILLSRIAFGVMAIISSLLLLYFGVIAAKQRSEFEVTVVLFFLAFLLLVHIITFAFRLSVLFVVIGKSFPDGCKNISASDTLAPTWLPISCNRYLKFTVPVLIISIFLLIILLSGLISAITLSRSLHRWLYPQEDLQSGTSPDSVIKIIDPKEQQLEHNNDLKVESQTGPIRSTLEDSQDSTELKFFTSSIPAPSDHS